MPQISPTEFYALPLRVHTFLADVPLHDVWAVDLPMHRDGVTLSEFLRRASQDGCDTSDAEINRFPPVARALFRLRFFLGRIFRLEAEPKDALAASFGSRLTAEDRARSFAVSGTPEGLFRVVYRFENEQLLEIQNRTVHAAALSALAERADSYRFYFAVYVRQTTWITPLYMGLTNHPMFGSPGSQCNPDSLWGSPGGTVRSAFGKICPGTSTTNVDASLGFGGQQTALYAVGGPRSAQFTAKLYF